MAMARARARDMVEDMDMVTAVINKAKKLYQNIVNLKLKIWLFLLYVSSRQVAKRANLEIKISRQKYNELYKILKKEPVTYFEEILGELTDEQKGGIKELFQESYLLKVMKYTLANTKYEEFDDDQVLKDFHQEIKDFIAENKEIKR
jgi:uncharacterized membrane-anchored protein